MIPLPQDKTITTKELNQIYNNIKQLEVAPDTKKGKTMKKLLLTVCLMIGLLPIIMAQKTIEGSFEFIKDLKKLNIVIDYSEVVIEGLSEESFIVLKTLEEDEGEEWRNYWNNKAKKIFFIKFCNAINKNKDLEKFGFLVGDFPDALYSATYKLEKVDEDGELYGKVIFTENSSKKTLAIIKLNGDGGHWGSIENLMGDAFEKAGELLGKYLTRKVYLHDPAYSNENNPDFNY